MTLKSFRRWLKSDKVLLQAVKAGLLQSWLESPEGLAALKVHVDDAAIAIAGLPPIEREEWLAKAGKVADARRRLTHQLP